MALLKMQSALSEQILNFYCYFEILPFHGCLSGTSNCMCGCQPFIRALKKCLIVSSEWISSVGFRGMLFTEISEVSWSEECENGRISYRNHALWLFLKESFTQDQTSADGTHTNTHSLSLHMVWSCMHLSAGLYWCLCKNNRAWLVIHGGSS